MLAGTAGAAPKVNAEAAILLDGATGRILYRKNIDAPLHPASMTKMMTEYLVLEAVKKGELTWHQLVSVSSYAAAVAGNRMLSNVALSRDEKYSIRELYEAMVIYSANGATIALAEAVSGTETVFLKEMNETAARMGLANTAFYNCTGLNNKDLKGMHPTGTAAEIENVMSAKSTARLAYYLLREFPEITETAGIDLKVWRAGSDDRKTMRNWNWMIPGMRYGYRGVDGLKTGSTKLAGCNFTGTARRGGLRLISVVMKTDSYRARFDATKVLFDYGFKNYRREQAYPPGFSGNGQSVLQVEQGSSPTVRVMAAGSPTVLVTKNGERLTEAVFAVLPGLTGPDGQVAAPLAIEQVVGHVFEKAGPGDDYIAPPDTVTRLRFAVATRQAVERTGIFHRVTGFFKRVFGKVFGFIRNKIMDVFKMITWQDGPAERFCRGTFYPERIGV